MRKSQHAFKQFGETEKLKITFIGRAQGYRQNEAYTEIVNETQKMGLPKENQLIEEFENFKTVLEAHDVEVRVPDFVGKFVYDQLTPRDIGVVIGNKLILCNMKRKSRRYEIAGIFPHITDFGSHEPDVLIPPVDVLLEGGDILIDKGNIFVGISQRTNKAGFEWLRSTFKNEFDIIPLYTKPLKDDENVLHLDCAFNPVGQKLALIYTDGFREIPDHLRDRYEWIEMDRREQDALATNVLSISPEVVVARDHPDCWRVNDILRKKGLTVEAIPFNGAPATGGSFRCCTLPLIREQ